MTGTALITLAHGARAVTGASIYAASVSLLFGTSAAYHRGSWSPRARVLMQRLDHSMIFVLIAGTYTPFSLLLLHGGARWTVFGATAGRPRRWGARCLHPAGTASRRRSRRPRPARRSTPARFRQPRLVSARPAAVVVGGWLAVRLDRNRS